MKGIYFTYFNLIQRQDKLNSKFKTRSKKQAHTLNFPVSKLQTELKSLSLDLSTSGRLSSYTVTLNGITLAFSTTVRNQRYDPSDSLCFRD